MIGFVRRGCQCPACPRWQAARCLKNLSVHHSCNGDFTRSTAGADVSHTSFQLRVLCSRRHRKCPLHLSSAFRNRANWRTLHPSPADIHTPVNCRFLTAQALPLRQRRFWCPRNSRGEITICPAKWPRRCPQPRSVRVQSTGTINPRPGHVRVQSMTASASAVFPSARTLQIRAQSVSLGSPRPRSGREPAVSRNLDRPGNVRAAASSFPV